MRYLLIIFFALLASCSSQKEANTDSINIKISKEIISNFDQTKHQIISHLQNKNNKSEIFSNSWVSVIKATKTFDEELHIEDNSFTFVHRINQDGSITLIARMSKDGKREKTPKGMGYTAKKTK